MKVVIDAVENITGRRPKTIQQVKAELISFLAKNHASDLIVDKDDVVMLFELAAIYSDIDTDKLINTQLLSQLSNQELYKRVGRRLIPKQRSTDLFIIEKIAETVIGLHPDLHYIIKKHGISFVDDINVVFSFEQIRSIENFPKEHSGVIIFPRIRTKQDRDKIIPLKYLNDKVWTFKTLRDKYSRLDGRYFTTAELYDLITNRQIITHGNYR